MPPLDQCNSPLENTEHPSFFAPPFYVPLSHSDFISLSSAILIGGLFAFVFADFLVIGKAEL